MAEYILHCFAQSGNAYKAALMLQLCSAEWEPRFVDFFNGETQTPEFRELNEMGEVPVLEHQGQHLSQSGVILDYLAQQLQQFGPQDEDERLEIMRWLFFDNHKLTANIATLRYLLKFAKTEETPITDFLRKRAHSALAILNHRLDEHQFVIGAQPTIADLSLCAYLFLSEEYGMTWDEYPQIARWLAAIRALPNWQAQYDLMPGQP